MRNGLERRLQAIEIEQAETMTGEVWIELHDGMLRGRRGETVARDASKWCALAFP